MQINAKKYFPFRLTDRDHCTIFDITFYKLKIFPKKRQKLRRLAWITH